MTDHKTTDATIAINKHDTIMKAFDHMPVAVGVYNKAGHFLYINKMFRQLHRLDDIDVSIDTIADMRNAGLFSDWEIDTSAYFAKVVEDLTETGEHVHQLEIRGRIISIHDVLIDGELIISTQKDLTEQIKLEREIAYLASHDMMTGLANRVSFEAQLAHAIRLSAQSGRHFSVLMADLDRFKQINDTYGHAAGDDVLREIACRFRASLRHDDFVARLGGDEFVFLCRGDERRAQALAARLASSGVKPIGYGGSSLSVGVSVGYAVFPSHGGDQETLLRAADTALYQAKAIGHGAIQRYEPPEEAA